MVVIIVVVFVFCWLPFFITNMVNQVSPIPETSLMAGVYFFQVTLTYVNSCANPLLYGFLSDNFKQSFRKVLCIHKANGVGSLETGRPRTEPLFMSRDHTQGFNGHMQMNQVCQSIMAPAKAKNTNTPHLALNCRYLGNRSIQMIDIYSSPSYTHTCCEKCGEPKFFFIIISVLGTTVMFSCVFLSVY